ncbi:MAG: L-lactate permease [Candidatus Thorarchaeota archaeon]|nr:L-lactate permease [Candidatus Thorarchaeota archaeon]
MDPLIGLLLIITPIVLAFLMLIVLKKAADVTGVVVWLVTLVIAVVAFQTDIGVALVSSVAGIVKSFPISLMVATSILMMTYMQETGSLQRLIVFFKTLGGGSKPMQVMLISLGLGLFLVGIGATPVTMLPPVMLALGFSPLVAVALPSIGYDPLTTFALLGVPVKVFVGEYNQASGAALTLSQAGEVFAMFMPVITTGIAISMLWIAGGRKLLFQKESLFLAIISGVTAGGVAIVANSPLVHQTILTNVYAGAAVIFVLYAYTRLQGKSIIDRSGLDEKDHEVEQNMRLRKASIPWTILVILCLATTLIEPIRTLLMVQLDWVVQVGPYPHPISTKILWQAYTLMFIALILSFPFFKHDNDTMKRTFSKFMQRAPRPVLAAAIFFAMAEVMNYSGYIPSPTGWVEPSDPSNNMIYLLASMTSATLGSTYPVTAAFLGLLAGFISGSETSAIAMFTRYHYEASSMIGANAVVVAASNGIGGGLASVISPAKIQNAAAVIDEIGIEGEVIRYGAVVAVLMTVAVAILTMLWAFA